MILRTGSARIRLQQRLGQPTTSRKA
uniref:Uncharacterized protein n=1 Tax=Anguilla anguilla TaxID=7936 RepID=A0A0E9SKL0_ANGAN